MVGRGGGFPIDALNLLYNPMKEGAGDAAKLPGLGMAVVGEG